MFLLSRLFPRVLFDSGAPHSFITASCVNILGLKVESLEKPLHVNYPLRIRVRINQICCDALIPRCPLTTRQPVEIYESHVMRPTQVQTWPLGPTPHPHNIYVLYKNDLFTIVFNYNLYKNGSIAHKFYKIQDKAILAVSSTLRPRMLPIPKRVFGT